MAGAGYPRAGNHGKTHDCSNLDVVTPLAPGEGTLGVSKDADGSADQLDPGRACTRAIDSSESPLEGQGGLGPEDSSFAPDSLGSRGKKSRRGNSLTPLPAVNALGTMAAQAANGEMCWVFAKVVQLNGPKVMLVQELAPVATRSSMNAAAVESTDLVLRPLWILPNQGVVPSYHSPAKDAIPVIRRLHLNDWPEAPIRR